MEMVLEISLNSVLSALIVKSIKPDLSGRIVTLPSRACVTSICPSLLTS